METIYFGGGCFWCTEAVFKLLKGVSAVMPGYAGGDKKFPTYEQVQTGETGHAEVVRVDYDSTQIKLEDLLTVFFASHDATSLNRQGDDIGPQYRSMILYSDKRQKEIIEKHIKHLMDVEGGGELIVTEVKLIDRFYRAEKEHLNYYHHNGDNVYSQNVIQTKVEKVQNLFPRLLK